MVREAPPPLGPVRSRTGIETYEACATDGERLFVKRVAAAPPLSRQRFAREKRLAQTLQHPALAGLRGAGENWFACDFIEAALDKPQIAMRHRSADAIEALIGELAALLAYLHGRGITHGDIKPAHIRFRDNQPVLVDFGIAAIGGDDPLSGHEIAGTPRWMAPEQLRAGTTTPAGDIWSLSAVGLWLLEGQLPLMGNHAAVLAKRDAGIHHEFKLSAHDGDGGLAGLLARGLEHRPQRRPTAAMLAGALFKRSLAGQSITSVTAG